MNCSRPKGQFRSKLSASIRKDNSHVQIVNLKDRYSDDVLGHWIVTAVTVVVGWVVKVNLPWLLAHVRFVQ